MAELHWILIQGTAVWRIVHVSASSSEMKEASSAGLPSDVAAVVADALKSDGYQGESILLALDSVNCLAVSLTLDDVNLGRQRQATLYQLEPWLPVAAEDVVCDFAIHDNHVLGVAVRTAMLKPLVDEFENRGVVVQSIAPAAMMAIQYHLTHTNYQEPHVVLWGHGDRVNVFFVRGQKPLIWQLVEAEPTPLTHQLELQALAQREPLTVFAYNLSDSLWNALSRLSDVGRTERSELQLDEAVAVIGAEVLGGNVEPLIELRRDALAIQDAYRPVQRLSQFTMISAVAFLVALSITFLLQAYRYDALVDECQSRQAAIFREIMPGKPIPAGIRSRLESERTKLAGLRGNSAELPERPSTLNSLYQLLASLPKTVRYCVRDVRLEHGQITIQKSELRSHGDADALVAGLQERGFQVELPQTEQLTGGRIGLRLSAKQIDKTGQEQPR